MVIGGLRDFLRGSSFVESERPIIVVDDAYTAGQTAQAIIAEVTGGLFATSIGAYYKKYHISRTLDADELREWQKKSAAEAAREASMLAELFVNSLASLTPAGDLVVTLDDIGKHGLSWQHVLFALPMMAYLRRGAKALKIRIAGTGHAGPREVTLTADVVREFNTLTVAERQAVIAEARAATTVDDAVAIIQHEVALRKGTVVPPRGPAHHIATNKNTVSALTGGPWTQRYEAIFKKAGMTLRQAENIVHIAPHQGPHSQAYHEAILDELIGATRGMRGQAYRDALLKKLDELANEILTPGTRLHGLLTE